MGVKIPSKITKNGTNDRIREDQEMKDESLNTPHRLSFSFSPSRYLSPALNVLKNVPGNVPRNVPKKSDTFSGIACEVNGVEESAADKGAPLALYVGYVFNMSTYLSVCPAFLPLCVCVTICLSPCLSLSSYFLLFLPVCNSLSMPACPYSHSHSFSPCLSPCLSVTLLVSLSVAPLVSFSLSSSFSLCVCLFVFISYYNSLSLFHVTLSSFFLSLLLSLIFYILLFFFYFPLFSAVFSSFLRSLQGINNLPLSASEDEKEGK